MDYKKQLANYLSNKTGRTDMDFGALLETPPELSLGDFALPCFQLSKVFRKAPGAIALELKENFSDLPGFLEGCEATGGYLNFFLKKIPFVQETLETILEAPADYGRSGVGEGRNVVIDYSSINIAKPFHIGHLSTTAIGSSLYKIYNFLGYHSVGVNHLGDWGTQFGKLIVAYKLWGNKEEIEKNSIRAMLDIYVRFHKEAKDKPELENEARAWFKKIEDGDEEALSIFNWFKELTIKEVDKVYDLLGVKFDSYAGESFYNDKMQSVIDELEQKGLLADDKGAKVVKLEEYGMNPCLILKSDGATLYATRDLAAAFYRKKTYDFYKCLYVVAYQQTLHFKQWFKVVELMGYDWAKDLKHVAFGMVSMTEGTLSTRKGKVIFLEDILKSVIQRAGEIIAEKNPDLENKEETARDIGVGALLYSTLSLGRIKDIVFDPERILNFDGETGPYVQYTHARACSLLKKAGEVSAEPDFSALSGAQAYEVAKKLSLFPETVMKAAEKYEPYLITRYVTELAQLFNRFYYDVRVIDEDEGGTAARLLLTKAAAGVIKSALALLGINAPERM